MTKRLLPLLLLIFLSSCATIFTQKTYKMEVNSTTYNQVKVYDSTYTIPAKVEIKRSKEDLLMVFSSDSITKNHIIKARLNSTFIYGNLSLIPWGYLVDLNTQKRFDYGESVTVNTNDTLAKMNTPTAKQYEVPNKNVRDYFTKNKGQLNVIAALPWINSFHFKPSGETAKNSTGFLGIATGVEYFYSEKNFLGLYASAVMDFPIPIPAPIFHDGEHEFFHSLAVGVTHNHKINRFTVGYGLNYSRNTWELSNDEYNPAVAGSIKPANKSNHSLGLIANGYFQLWKIFFVGLSYKPSLIALNNDAKLNYEHVISLDFVWKFRIGNK